MSYSPHRFIRALLRQPIDCTPIWIMRQAGRYLPEYRTLRRDAGDFLTLCKTPSLACEATLQPIRRFNLDAAIIFSDILTIPDAMGLDLYFLESEGPRFRKPIQSLADIQALHVTDPSKELNYVIAAIQRVRRELNNKIPLIGFSGSPWTLATYMIEGGSSKTFQRIKRWLYCDSYALHELLNILTQSVTGLLNAQIEAGAQALMIFDTWGGLLTTRCYQEFSLHYMKKICMGLTREYQGQRIPIILFTKGGGLWLESMVESGCDAIGLDWTIDLSDAKKRIQGHVALQGNLDPSVLYSTPEKIREEVQLVLTSYGSDSGHVFNLGHGIPQDILFEHVQVLVDAVHEMSRRF